MAQAPTLKPAASVFDPAALVDTALQAVLRTYPERDVSEAERGASWTTLGRSANIVDASFKALIDAIEWALAQKTDHANQARRLSHGDVGLKAEWRKA